ncbi:unnamed protein product [Thelazia callipaeda]|uniref:Uncharacterized protein n=1 Tax=Thelazia callipaeda TaxID=103827 RepID=A0A0N5CWE7_THECL|nr:unnamed protein product [Thelazia callipaeda]
MSFTSKPIECKLENSIEDMWTGRSVMPRANSPFHLQRRTNSSLPFFAPLAAAVMHCMITCQFSYLALSLA